MDILGKKMTMGDIISDHRITIIVNVASKWAFAHKSYVELVNVYNEYKNHGL